jgi:hypothetical protein
MQYLLMLYVNESDWTKLSKAEQEHGVAAYTAYTEALTKSGVLKGANRLQPSVRYHRAHHQWQNPGTGWTLCRLEGAAWRLLLD